MEIDEEFEPAITADVDGILQQPIVDTAERVEQLADVLLSYAEGETVCLCTHPLLLTACTCTTSASSVNPTQHET
jgi:hypothetical protein